MVEKLVDYHLHSEEPFKDQISPHALGTWSDYWRLCRKINLRKNIKIIPGNANHPPHYFIKDNKNIYPPERNGILRGDALWEKFLTKNLNFREKHQPALLGLEIDYFANISLDNYLEAIHSGYLCFKKNASSKLKNQIKTKPFDYLILSNHFVFGRGIDYDQAEFNLLKSEVNNDLKVIIRKYWQNILNLTLLGKKILAETKIQKIIIGHLDLIKIISLFEKNPIDVYAGHENLINKILKNIRKYNLCLEYNPSGILKKIGAYPNDQILNKAKKMGIKIVFGSDCHSIKQYSSLLKNLNLSANLFF